MNDGISDGKKMMISISALWMVVVMGVVVMVGELVVWWWLWLWCRLIDCSQVEERI